MLLNQTFLLTIPPAFSQKSAAIKKRRQQTISAVHIVNTFVAPKRFVCEEKRIVQSPHSIFHGRTKVAWSVPRGDCLPSQSRSCIDAQLAAGALHEFVEQTYCGLP
jgi:hypothetical protein